MNSIALNKFLEAALENINALVDQNVADVERRQEADDIASRSTAEQRQAVFIGLADQRFGQVDELLQLMTQQYEMLQQRERLWTEVE